MSTLSAGHWLIALLSFVIFVFLPIIYPIYLWQFKKDHHSAFLKFGRRLRILMGVLSLFFAIFSCLFIVSIYLLDIQSNPALTLESHDLAFLEILLTAGGGIVFICCLVLSWLLLRNWNKAK